MPIDPNTIENITVQFGVALDLPRTFPTISQGVVIKELTLGQYNVKEKAWWDQVYSALNNAIGPVVIDLSGVKAALIELQAQITLVNASLYPYDTVFDLQAVLEIGRSEDYIYTTIGQYNRLDGEGKRYIWDPASTAVPNESSVLIPDDIDPSDAGRYLQI